MRYMPGVLFLLLGLSLAGCETGSQADAGRGGVSDAEATAAAEEEAELQRRADRAGVMQAIQAMPEIGAAQLSVGTGTGGGAARHVTVTVVRDDDQPVDDRLAQRIVERVINGFPAIAPSNVAVRDATDPDYLYVGDLGRLE